MDTVTLQLSFPLSGAASLVGSGRGPRRARGSTSLPDSYEVEGVRVLVAWLPSMTEAGRWALHGSVLVRDGNPRHYQGARLHLFRGTFLLRACPLTPFGSFAFEDLGGSDYRLLLTLGARRLWFNL